MKRAPVARPPLVFEIIPKESKPRQQVMAELRGPAAGQFDPNQTSAEGAKE